MIHPSTVSGIVAFFLWGVTDTRLAPGHFRNAKGEITFWSTLSILLVQIGLWVLVGLIAMWIVPHLPAFLLAGWRFPATVFCSSLVQWFAFLMILQYSWMIVGPSVNTAIVLVMAKFGSKWARQTLNDAPHRCELIVTEQEKRG